MDNYYNIWDEALDYMEDELSPFVFQTYIDSLEPVYLSEDTLVLKAADLACKNCVINHYNVLVTKALRYASNGKNYNVKYVLNDDDYKEIMMADMTRNSSSLTNVRLNPRYTFDTFVVGPNNRLAHAASYAVAQSPGKKYNPLFIYGGAGLGKTHLLQAIAQHTLKENRALKVAFVTSEQFTNDLIDAIRNKTNLEFRKRYRQVDVLLVDDIQFIANKVSTQEEFFHTFNDLYTAGKQIILTSDKHPKDIAGFEERLRTRFESGLTCDISPPDYETRFAILLKKVEEEKMEIGNDLLDFVAGNMGSNIRELEGVLSKIKALSDISDEPLTVEVLRENLKDVLTVNNVHISVDTIIQTVARHFGVTYADILSAKRTMNIANARQVAMYLTRELTDLSLPAIGEMFGGRNHSTVLHAVNKVKVEENDDISFKKELSNITNLIKDENNPQR